MITGFAGALNYSVKGGELVVYMTIRLHEVPLAMDLGTNDFDGYLARSRPKSVMRKKTLTWVLIVFLLFTSAAVWLYVKQG
ncbi:hypothetical protein, partial [Pseudomonas viridiflava]|uniref:hypothetical protein n=1 Tax=Pseudomonas viridiflava TaxID=33069 RepID=UPI00197F87F2